MNVKKIKWYIIYLCIALIIISCSSQKQTRGKGTAPKSIQEISLILNIPARQLYVYKGDDTLRSYSVAVGQSKYPTPVGNFKVHRIDWNPEWNPPESDWTKDKNYTPPGDPANPMGRVRIVYKMPYTIHGTREISSLGKALSHGSVRMANADVIELAKFLMEESGTGKPDDWYQQVLANPKKMVSVKLKKPIPLANFGEQKSL
jgi:murein L,D-transpeptidase YcbB/YkuD